MARGRKMRHEETRDSEARKHNMRDILKMMYADPLYVDPRYIPDDVEYRWIRCSTLGVPDTSRLPEMNRQGWIPVPASRHPDMAYEDPLGRLTHTKGIIFNKGLILCERPKELGEIQRKALEERNYQSLVGLPGVDHLMGEPGLPGKIFQNETAAYKGISFGI